MMSHILIRSCEVVNWHEKHPTSLLGNNNLIKNSRSYRGCHISNNITSISEDYQLCYELLKLLIYKVWKPTSEKVFSASQRSRELMLTGRQNSTNQLLSQQPAASASTPEARHISPASSWVLPGSLTILIPQTTGFQTQ